MERVLVFGGAGFIGSNFVRSASERGWSITVVDALTYAGSLTNLEGVLDSGLVEFVRGDIRDYEFVNQIIETNQPKYVVNFAAESHVDNSIEGPRIFLETNVEGVFNLLEASRNMWKQLPTSDQNSFRFLQVSTDEVYGSLGDSGYFTEESNYQPNSPYSATKAAGDHLVRAWNETYKLPAMLTNCSNNYGPRQFPEKLIPVMISNALSGQPLPIYGDGKNIRDWIHVDDHCKGIFLALEKGQPGEKYCFGGKAERANIDLVQSICTILDEKRPLEGGKSYSEQITFVTDRPGHDRRYAIDDTKSEQQLGFSRTYNSLEDGLRNTVDWYLDNQDWLSKIKQEKK